jgi:hypothetical protein
MYLLIIYFNHWVGECKRNPAENKKSGLRRRKPLFGLTDF